LPKHQSIAEPIVSSNKFFIKWLRVRNKEKIVAKMKLFFDKSISIHEGKENKDVNKEFRSLPKEERMLKHLEDYA
jgi:hypothetical protein